MASCGSSYSGSGGSAGSSAGTAGGYVPDAGGPLPPPGDGTIGADGRPAEEYDPSHFTPSEQSRINNLRNQPGWEEELDAIKQRYPGFNENEFYSMMLGESNLTNPGVKAKNSSASGYFQFTDAAASDLGTTTAQIRSMTPAQQLNTYGKYMDRWNYNTDNSFGTLQAAPAYSSKPPGTVIYSSGSSSANSNPGWQNSNGDVTVAGVNNYYNKRFS